MDILLVQDAKSHLCIFCFKYFISIADQIDLDQVCDLFFIIYYQNIDIGHLLVLLFGSALHSHLFFVYRNYNIHLLLLPYFFLEKFWLNWVISGKKAAEQSFACGLFPILFYCYNSALHLLMVWIYLTIT